MESMKPFIVGHLHLIMITSSTSHSSIGRPTCRNVFQDCKGVKKGIRKLFSHLTISKITIFKQMPYRSNGFPAPIDLLLDMVPVLISIYTDFIMKNIFG